MPAWPTARTMNSKQAHPERKATMPSKTEDLSMFLEAFHRLRSAAEDGLRAAHAFGQITDALSRMGWSYADLGAQVDRSGATIYTYAKLYRMYPDEARLLREASELGTYDISILTLTEGSLRTKYGYQCGVCHSWNTHRRQVPAAGTPAGEVYAARFLPEAG